MEDYKEAFDLEKTIGEIMLEVMALRAQNTVLYAILKEYFAQISPPIHYEQFHKLYDKALYRVVEDLHTSHPWFEGYWKEVLKGLKDYPDNADGTP